MVQICTGIFKYLPMAQSALKKIRAEAKRIKKRHPHKYDRLKNPWARGYIVEAAKKYKGGRIRKKRKVSGITKKRPKPKAGKRRTKRKSTAGLRLVKNVTKTTNERVLAGKKRRHKPKRRSRAIGTVERSRSIGSKGNTGLLIGLGIGAAVLLLLNRKPAQPNYQGYTLPPVQQTGNLTRDQQSQQILTYAMSANLAIDAVIKLIDKLNSSNDQEVNNIYDHVNTTGDVGYWV